MNVGDHVNGYGSIKDEDDKEPVALSLHPNAFDRLTGSDPSADLLDHSVLGNSSTSHNAAFQEVTFPTSFIDSRGVPSQSSVDCGIPRVQAPNHNHHPPRLLLYTPHQPPHPLHHRPPSPARRRCEEQSLRDTAPPPKFPRTPRSVAAVAAAAAHTRRDREQQERVEALEEERVEMLGEQQQQQQQAGRREQMESLEWERRMRVLVWEQEVLREKGRAAREKARAYRMKRRYYGAKLKRLGQDVPPPSSSSSGSEQDEWGSGERATKEEAIV